MKGPKDKERKCESHNKLPIDIPFTHSVCYVPALRYTIKTCNSCHHRITQWKTKSAISVSLTTKHRTTSHHHSTPMTSHTVAGWPAEKRTRNQRRTTGREDGLWLPTDSCISLNTRGVYRCRDARWSQGIAKMGNTNLLDIFWKYTEVSVIRIKEQHHGYSPLFYNTLYGINYMLPNVT